MIILNIQKINFYKKNFKGQRFERISKEQSRNTRHLHMSLPSKRMFVRLEIVEHRVSWKRKRGKVLEEG